jgi:DNA-binding IclR family transcriptional regulator
MAYFNFIRQDEASKHCHLGFKPVELDNQLLCHIGIRKEARPYRIDLIDVVQEVFHLVVLDQNNALYVDKVDLLSIRSGSQMVSSLGSRIPPYCSAVGKVLLAYMPESDAEMILQNLKQGKEIENEKANLKSFCSCAGRFAYAHCWSKHSIGQNLCIQICQHTIRFTPP